MPFTSFSQNPEQTQYNCGVEVRIENLTIKKRYAIVWGLLLNQSRVEAT